MVTEGEATVILDGERPDHMYIGSTLRLRL